MAGHHALPVYDLSDTFDRFDPASLEIAAWDDHPNALGHRRLFLALARSLVKDQTTLPLAIPHRRVAADSVPRRGKPGRERSRTGASIGS